MTALRLTPEQINQFEEDGFLVLKSFYDLHSEILPIQEAIHDVICLVAADYAPHIKIVSFSPQDFDSGYQELIVVDRALGALVYDAIKQLTPFMRLLASPKHDDVMKQLRACKLPGIAARGYGIRIDNPGEDRFLSKWHHDYFSQLRSPDGVVFWAPLRSVTEAMGPLEICRGSHKATGVKYKLVGDPQRYEDFEIEDMGSIVARYPILKITADVGDLVLIDFLSVHRSGRNVSNLSRWSMQMRLFGFENESGRRIGWCGSFASGVDFRKIHPEMFAHD